MSAHVLLVGFGQTAEAVARALTARGVGVSVVEDRPQDHHRARAAELGVTLIERPGPAALRLAVLAAGAVLPSPGIPDRHPVFVSAAEHAVPVLSEFDLAARWDDRPLVAITGTNGKTTVTTMVTEMLVASEIPAVAAGNTDVPLVEAIEDPTPAWFVVEASSFRLGHSQRFAPRVATWLNFAPDHLDVHRSLAAYEAAKSVIWRDLAPDATAVADVDDPVVARHTPAGGARIGLPGGAGSDLTHTVTDGWLTIHGERFLSVVDLPRALPHDLRNSLAATATALAAGAAPDAVRHVLRTFRGLPHRVALVARLGRVAFYDDSKSTTPHATIAAVAGFDRPVLIAGGRNKGLDLGALSELSDRVSSVVAIGDSADEIRAAFHGRAHVLDAGSMAEAVTVAYEAARPDRAVLLSPACASFDWYRNYGHRGDDFASHVRQLVADRADRDSTVLEGE